MPHGPGVKVGSGGEVGTGVQVWVAVGVRVGVRVAVPVTVGTAVGGGGGGSEVRAGIHITASNHTFLPLSPVQSFSDTRAGALLLNRNFPRCAQLPEPTSVMARWLVVA
jgi:hypothetical protein